ncbi:MAG: hypothetical protein HUJ70_15835 [Pseudobutyrivibrio sp.]|nr:hypothetical protein [Pseudobutyrivibrio sp.]
MDVSGMTAYLDTMYTNTNASNKASDVKKTASNISSQSTEEELTKAVKDFEKYFVEQVIKKFKESVDNMKEESDTNISMYSDYFMDATISQLAQQLVDSEGAGLTEDFVQSIMRTYNITPSSKSEETLDFSETEGEDAKDEVAKTDTELDM